jgi:predicted porin
VKKSRLLVLALCGFSAVASAQSTVIVYGVIDGAIRREVDNNDRSLLRVRDGANYTSNRIGFRGVEDLGNGANAHFVLESGFFSGTGQQTPISGFAFDRLAFIGVTTPYGTLDFGRLYGAQLYTAIAYDPFETHFTAIDPVTRNSISASQTSDNTLTSNSRTDNAVHYTNNIGNLTLRATYAFGEVAGNTNSGSTKSVGAVYQNKTFSIGAAATQKKLRADNSAPPAGPFYGNDTPATADFRTSNYYTFGGSYTVGELRATVGYASERRDTNTVNHVERNLWTGLRYNLTPLTAFTGGYFKTNLLSSRGSSTKDMYVLTASYLLSKRTTLFAEIDHSIFHGPEFPLDTIGQFLPTSIAATNSQAIRNGTMVGISHAF